MQQHAAVVADLRQNISELQQQLQVSVDAGKLLTNEHAAAIKDLQMHKQLAQDLQTLIDKLGKDNSTTHD